MSYTALARKWRPRNFAEMSGQEHVLRSLGNALDGRPRAPCLPVHRHARRGQDHHRAHLRQVPELRARPVGHALRRMRGLPDIDAGRFVDLIEVDAASRTKVEDTRDLLENVQYMPSRGRYKIYLIDEVHMLSAHSFNALLKTLEEPPPHVKFLLATTDPQRLPVTVLSRCLQFNLKRLPVSVIARAAGADPAGRRHRRPNRPRCGCWRPRPMAACAMRCRCSTSCWPSAARKSTCGRPMPAPCSGTVDRQQVVQLARLLAARRHGGAAGSGARAGAVVAGLPADAG